MRGTRLLVLGCVVAALVTYSTPAAAQASFGLRAGLWDGPDPFVGFEALVPLHSPWYFNPNVELVFGDHEDVAALNFDFHYDLNVGRPYFWVGAGPAVLYRDFDRGFGDGNETDVGLNLLVGIGARTGSGLVPYAQGKVVISDDTRAAVAVGIRF